MTRGKRSRPLIEPEPDLPISAGVDIPPYEPPIYIARGEHGKLLPGHAPLPGAGRPKSKSFSEAWREAHTVEQLVEVASYHVFKRLDPDAFKYVVDRLEGRPRQQLDVTTDSEPWWENVARMLRGEPPLLAASDNVIDSGFDKGESEEHNGYSAKKS